MKAGRVTMAGDVEEEHQVSGVIAHPVRVRVVQAPCASTQAPASDVLPLLHRAHHPAPPEPITPT